MSFQKLVKKIIEEDIQPFLERDGGGIKVVDIDEENKIVKVKLTGACQGCPFAQMTLANLVEGYLKRKVPEIKKVIPIQ